MKVVFVNAGMQEMGGLQCLSAFLKLHGHECALVCAPRPSTFWELPADRLVDRARFGSSLWARWTDMRAGLAASIRSHDPDVIGFSVVSDDFVWSLQTAEYLRASLGVPIVFGNIHPTAHPEATLAHECVDFVVRGEGELPLLELLEALAGQRTLESVLGIGYRVGGFTKVQALRPLIEDLDTLPFPDKDLSYRAMPYLDFGYATVTGRGCPYRCTFCDNTTSMDLYRRAGHKKKWTRRHSPEYVVREILWAKERYAVRHVRFNDEDFSYDKDWIREFCALYGECVGIPYFAWVYPNTIDDEMVRILEQSGCDSVEMGIQSGAPRLRAEVLQRRTPQASILGAMKALRASRIRTTVDIIVGLPSETKEELDETALMLAEGRPWHLYAFSLRYYKSTKILGLAKERGLLTAEQIASLEMDDAAADSTLGGHDLAKSAFTKRYQTFLLLIPLMLPSWIRFAVRHDLVRFLPPLPPVPLVNLTKIVKRDRYNEFRIRAWAGLAYEAPRAVARVVRNAAQDLRAIAWRPRTKNAPTAT